MIEQASPLRTASDATTVLPRVERLRDFVMHFGSLLETQQDEASIIREGSDLLRRLIATDDWLPSRFAEADTSSYRQYLLHADSLERFSVVSFVWGPGQQSQIHDHTVWGIVGVLRGAELAQGYAQAADGRLAEDGAPARLERGEVIAVSPTVGDLHRVANAYQDRSSISIHVYGANIGGLRRSVYDLNGGRKTFISGYSNTELPNLWDRSKENNIS
jgi:predicted metal-dependent enzyme (double-stranded beta helix superfamily)